ncbi:MAG: type II CAAX endopeptidase family protein [Planctomycetota bacterium]
MSFDGDSSQGWTQEERYWPPGGHVDPSSTQSVICEGCRTIWHIHNDLAGFRKQCDCGHWLEIPSIDGQGAALTTTDESNGAGTTSNPVVPMSGLPARRERRQNALVPRTRDGHLVPGVDRRAEAHEPMSLTERAHIPVSERRRQFSGIFLELGLIALAFFGVPLLPALGDSNMDVVFSWLPVTAVIGGLVIVGVASISPHVRKSDFKLGKFEHWAEALAATAGFFVVALGLMSLFEDRASSDEFFSDFSLPVALFVVAVCPALFEELAFRGAVFARFRHLFGVRSGIIYTSIAFALGHGQTLGLPIHVGLGFYLTWLRHRSGTIWPGVLCHFLYNGSIVLWTMA